MQRRPIGVSVVSWVIVIYYLISLLLALLLTANADKFLQMQHHLLELSTNMIRYIVAMMFVTPILNLIAGAGMLRGKNWGRYLFLVYNTLVFTVALIIFARKMETLVYIIVFLGCLYFLFNRRAKDFFVPPSSHE